MGRETQYSRVKIWSILLMSIIAIFTSFSAVGASVSIKATLDSAYIIMGRQTTLHVEIMEPDNVNGSYFLPDTAWNNVEINRLVEPSDTSSLGNGKRQILQDIILQSFDSGLYTLPPVLYIAEGETIASNRPVLKVIPVAVDTLITVHDYADVSEIDRHFFDYFPDWFTDYGLWILLFILAVGIGLYVYLKYMRTGRIPLMPAKKPIPPYEMAIQQLNELKESNLCERGLEKEYYTRLIDILRVYMDKRFNINAMEMTSNQILHALQHNEATRVPRQYMTKVLEMADFVKFAKVRPMPDDNIQAFKSALQFVEDTRPQPTPDAEDNSSEKSVADSNSEGLKEKKEDKQTR